MSYKLPDSATFQKWLDGLSDDEREQIRQELRHDLDVAKKFDEDQKKWYGTSKNQIATLHQIRSPHRLSLFCPTSLM
ncbi:hypothetical protein [Schleiferilactobacillus harbinensis]|uniref:Uncharacterized protein n=1 Tax=Schleiferilactobacillus harbinensis TaxID=304207 RepID=A0ABU7SYU3_9LACO|nr:hypothetical protein [Schleiferilactobacillus harbinensis]